MESFVVVSRLAFEMAFHIGLQELETLFSLRENTLPIASYKAAILDHCAPISGSETTG
jgi:hypothetical protein